MLISIIIPAYNVEDYIEECIHSAFAQTHKPIEVICIDNNSTDNTWQKLKQLQETYPSLLIDKELKPGAPAARNKGLALSNGEWIQFLDADDLLLPEKIEHQMHLIKNKPEVCFIAAASRKKHINGQSTISIPKQDHPFKSLFTTNLGNTCSNLWNKTYINQINGWDEGQKSSQEADLMFRLLQINSQVIFDAEPLTIIQERETGQISTKHPQDNWVRYFNKRVEILNWIKENDTKLYASHQTFFNDSLFGILKIISNQKPDGLKVSSQLWKSYLKGKYVPSPAQNHSTKPYLFLYKILGFTTAERIRLLLGKQ
jgi:glycosyltransferase involved in cell wall biosynthesis